MNHNRDRATLPQRTPNPSDNYVKTVLLVLAAFCAPLLVLIVYGGDIGELVGRSSHARVGFLMRLGASVLCAIIAHAVIRRWLLACLVASLTFLLAMMVFSFFGVRSQSSFFLIGLAVLFLFGFAVAALVGIIFQLSRKP